MNTKKNIHRQTLKNIKIATKNNTKRQNNIEKGLKANILTVVAITDCSQFGKKITQIELYTQL